MKIVNGELVKRLCIFINIVILIGCFSGFFFSCVNHQYKGIKSWAEYNKNHRKLYPYVVELTSDKGRLLYYGSLHTVNCKDIQFADIEKRWKTFQPDIALSEGGIWPLETNKDKAILKYGEQGLLRYLAARDGVPIKSIEPPRKLESIYLLKHFSPKRIKVFYILRQAAIYQLLHKSRDEVGYVEYLLNELSKLKPFRGYPRNLSDFEESIQFFFPGLKDWQSIPHSWFYDSNTGGHTWLSRMFRMVNDYRNQKMVQTIIKEFENGRSIFALVGRSHVIMQQQAIWDYILKTNEKVEFMKLFTFP